MVGEGVLNCMFGYQEKLDRAAQAKERQEKQLIEKLAEQSK